MSQIFRGAFRASSKKIWTQLHQGVIDFELLLHICLYRALKRRVQYHGKTRQDIGEGCQEKIDRMFLKFIVATYGLRKKNMQERMQHFAEQGKTVHYLKTPAQIEGFLATYPREVGQNIISRKEYAD